MSDSETQDVSLSRELFGELPEQWEYQKLSHNIHIKGGQIDPTEEPYSSMLLVSPNHIESGTGRIIGQETASDQGAQSGKYVCEQGDVIYSKIRPELAKATVAPERCLCSADMYPIDGTPEFRNQFLAWLFISAPFTQWVSLQSQRVAMPKVNRETLSRLRIPTPPIEWQDAIISYLEKRTTRVDKGILRAKELLDHLQEKRKTLIKQSTTGSLSPVESIDSGVDWMGQVPKHWDVVRTRFVAELHSGHTPDRSNDEYWEDTDIPWVTTSDIKPFREGRKRYLYETEHQISELGMENSGAHLLPESTVFLSRTASVGFSGIMGEPMATSQDFANWVCGDDIIPEYLLYVFRSMDQEFNRLMQGSTHKTIYMPDIKSFKTPLPPLEEQREIVDHIETETERLWELIDRVEETIDLLEEKRQALITAAVTGQIDVSDVKNEAKASHT